MDDGRDALVRAAGPRRALGEVTVWLERPVRRLGGSHRANPLPHAGTISVFLLGVVVVSGLYLTLFYQFGYEASYRSVAAMEGHAIQRVARAVHRYASAALVVTTVVHAWRIFTAARFTGRRRRWRWATGLSALLVVWLTGVTGYWLVWDVRAQALSEATANLVQGSGWGTALAVRSLLGVDGGSGAGTLLVLWLAHLALTAVLVWFTWRHLRRSRMAWLPPTVWLVLMGGALLLVSLALPLGLDAPADPARPVPPLTLDPFVLFLLPPLLSSRPALWLVVGLVAFVAVLVLPRLLRRVDPPPVVIDEAACVGCELCVVDCPYEALSMVEVDDRPVARVTADDCVACGICLGSCVFDAITLELPGVPEPLRAGDGGRLLAGDLTGTTVSLVCDRHEPDRAESGHRAGGGDHDRSRTVALRCAGLVNPGLVSDLEQRGASSIRLVGCAPGDCRFGLGNRLASERLAGERAPRLPRRWQGMVSEDWVSEGELAAALADPDRHPTASVDTVGLDGQAFLGAGMVVGASILAVALATRAPFSADGAEQLRVVLDHTPGLALEADPATPVGRITGLEASIDGRSLGVRPVRAWGGDLVAVADWDLGAVPPLDPGADLDGVPGRDRRTVEATVVEATVVEATVVALTAEGPVPVATVDLDPVPADGGQPEGDTARNRTRTLVRLVDVPPEPGVDEGRRVFRSRAAGCDVCHSVDPGDDGVGPSLAGVATVAGDRVPGLDAEGYLRQSILLPDQYIVDGWPAGQMLPIYRESLSEEELDALVTYLLSLEEER